MGGLVHINMFLMELCLSFCRLIRDVLYLLSLAPTQILTNAQKILLSCCMVQQLPLEPTNKGYLDLMAHQYFYLWHMLPIWEQYSFSSRMGYRMTCLELCYSHIKNWHKRFFFMFNVGWKLLVNEANCHKFPIQALQCHILKDNDFNMTLSNWEEVYLDLIYSWTEERPNVVWSNVHMAKDRIDPFFVSLD